ncbi:MAG: hypothetical protein GX864_02175 [Mollicutes bacterium]|nr:hypothetical protein [Mollicutes bacterium]
MGNNDNIYRGDIYAFSKIKTKFGNVNIFTGPGSLVTKNATLIQIDQDTFADLDSFKTTIEDGRVVMTCQERDYLKTYPISNCCHYVDESSLVKLSAIEEVHTELENNKYVYSYNPGNGQIKKY